MNLSVTSCNKFSALCISVALLALSPALAAQNGPAELSAVARYDKAYRLLQSDERAQLFPEIVTLLRPAAEQGHAKTQYSLAIRYLFGQGVKKDYTTAADWLKKAAIQGLPEAQLSLGLRYYWGQEGCQRLCAGSDLV